MSSGSVCSGDLGENAGKAQAWEGSGMLSPRSSPVLSPGLGVLREQQGLPKPSRLVGLQVEPSLLPSQECGCSRSPVAIPGQAQTSLSLLHSRDSL